MQTFNLLETFIHDGKKRVVVGKPVFNCTRDMYFEYVDYGTPLHKQKRVRVYLSELETGRKGDDVARKDTLYATKDGGLHENDEPSVRVITTSPTVSPQLTDRFITINNENFLSW